MTGTVVGTSRSPNTVSVQFDHRKSAVLVHCSYLKLEANDSTDDAIAHDAKLLKQP
jgi:hypothetical protein